MKVSFDRPPQRKTPATKFDKIIAKFAAQKRLSAKQNAKRPARARKNISITTT